MAAIFAEGIAPASPHRETVPTGRPGTRRTFPSTGSAASSTASRDWIALVPDSRREVYGGVGEESVYVAERARGRGVGRALLEAVIESARAGGLWTLQAGIFPENAASLAVHHALGFREVGVRERIGRLDGVWRDVVLLELRL